MFLIGSFNDNIRLKIEPFIFKKRQRKNRKKFLKFQNYREKYIQRNFNKKQVIDKELNMTLYNHKLYLKYIGITDE